MYRGKKVSVVFSTYNEEKSVRQVINQFFDTGFVDEVIAVDNNAVGNTKAEILATKATYVHEPKQGYGHGYMRALKEATGDLIIMTEVDGTFTAKDLHKFLLYSEDFEVVFGTRTARATIWSGAFMPWLVRLGNWGLAKLLEVLHNGHTITDVGCTYRLIRKDALQKIIDLFPNSKGDGKFSPEMMIWILRRKLKIVEIPVMYLPRIGDSQYTGTVWKAAKLGLGMTWLTVKYVFVKLKNNEQRTMSN